MYLLYAKQSTDIDYSAKIATENTPGVRKDVASIDHLKYLNESQVDLQQTLNHYDQVLSFIGEMTNQIGGY